jgi:hypothetical protein
MNKLLLFILTITIVNNVLSKASSGQKAWKSKGAIVQIKYDKSLKNVGVLHSDAKNKQKVVMRHSHKGLSQKWRVVKATGDKFMLKAMRGNFYLGTTTGHNAGLQKRPTGLNYDSETHALMKGK